jgi:ATP-dependent Lon protease
MGRNFYRISLGGVHDEAEIRGHRRTYVGAMPGRFIQAIRKAGSMNPLIIIDEIDKVTSDQRGDPSAALLEVLDPAQNQTFYDNYLGVPFDLSKVLFITTANDLSKISPPLRDRMEVIQLSGYTYEEKLEISKRYLVPKAVSNFGLDNFGLDDAILSEIIHGYTREAGVRQLDKVIQKLSAKHARILLEEKRALSFTKENLHQYLGSRRISCLTSSLHKHKVGVSTGLAWTPYGGEILQVEAILMPGSGKLILTGQLGDVMKESAQAAISYAKSHADVFGIAKEFFTAFDIHVHIPAGAIPKDGPSAGITLLSSILSVLTSRPVNGDYAMTGELNLQGAVLPIGGIKEKILAAKQEGLFHIIVPKLNENDLESLGDLRKDLTITLVEDVSEVLAKVLLPKAKC